MICVNGWQIFTILCSSSIFYILVFIQFLSLTDISLMKNNKGKRILGWICELFSSFPELFTLFPCSTLFGVTTRFPIFFLLFFFFPFLFLFFLLFFNLFFLGLVQVHFIFDLRSYRLFFSFCIVVLIHFHLVVKGLLFCSALFQQRRTLESDELWAEMKGKWLNISPFLCLQQQDDISLS